MNSNLESPESFSTLEYRLIYNRGPLLSVIPYWASSPQTQNRSPSHEGKEPCAPPYSTDCASEPMSAEGLTHSRSWLIPLVRPTGAPNATLLI